MNILITGATGFLGSHLCRRLVSEGHRVRAFTRPSSDRIWFKDLAIDYAVGDIIDIDSLHRAVENQDIVIHAAAHLSYWGKTRKYQTKVNVEGTRNLCLACVDKQVQRLIHVSSVATVGIPNDPEVPADENFVFNLDNTGLNYHLSKQQAEVEVLSQPDSPLDVVVVNPGTIFGVFGQQFRGSEMVDKVHRSSVVPYFLGGINTVHVEDVVDGICSAIVQGKRGERYILGGENITFRQIAETAAACLGVKRVFVPVPPVVTGLAATIQEQIGALTGRRPRFTHAVHYCAHRFHFYDSQKARNELRYNPRDFKQIVKDYLKFKQAVTEKS